MKILEPIVNAWKDVHGFGNFAFFIGKLLTYVVTFGHFGFPRAKEAGAFDRSIVVSDIIVTERKVMEGNKQSAEEKKQEADREGGDNVSLDNKKFNESTVTSEVTVPQGKKEEKSESGKGDLDLADDDSAVDLDKFFDESPIPQSIENKPKARVYDSSFAQMILNGKISYKNIHIITDQLMQGRDDYAKLRGYEAFAVLALHKFDNLNPITQACAAFIKDFLTGINNGQYPSFKSNSQIRMLDLISVFVKNHEAHLKTSDNLEGLALDDIILGLVELNTTIWNDSKQKITQTLWNCVKMADKEPEEDCLSISKETIEKIIPILTSKSESESDGSVKVYLQNTLDVLKKLSFV